MPEITNDIFLVETLDFTSKNITFTPDTWAVFAAQVNQQLASALHTGIIIGMIAGALGLYVGVWYVGVWYYRSKK